MYEYKCGKCGEVFEVIQRFSDEPLTTHEGCGGHVERLISAPSFQFKGSGFYITDYARGNGGAKTPGKTSESKPAPSSTESKPASSSSGEAKK
jgi:putative FmdB family regulatory protein